MKHTSLTRMTILMSLFFCAMLAHGGILTQLEQKLTPTNGAAGEQFGIAVSMDGDVAVAGAWLADPDAAADAGAAYVFERNAGGTNAWGQAAKLLAADRAAGDYFGHAVSVAGDAIVVGAYSANAGGTNDSGAAYVFLRNAGGTNAWGQVAKLTASDKQASDQFGISVAVDGDVAVVGAYTADVGGMGNAGAAYVFERNAGGTNAWGQVAKLTASDKSANTFFGKFVSVEGDVIAVTAVGADPGGVNNAGAAYVFERNIGGTNAWGQVAILTASDKAASDNFGSAVGVNGDAVVVGAVAADAGGKTNSGAAYVFERNLGGTNAWGQAAKLIASDKAADDEFGFSVSLHGDLALVGAHFDDTGTRTNTGAAYVFERNAGGVNAWGEVAKVMASDSANNGQFGQSVSLSGGAMLVGAFANAATNNGTAYRIHLQMEQLTQVVRYSNTNYFYAYPGEGLNNLGSAVAVDGDVAVAVAPDRWYDLKLLIFERNQGGLGAWGLAAVITNDDATLVNYDSACVAVSGDVIALTRWQSGDSVNHAPLYVYERNCGGTNAWGLAVALSAGQTNSHTYFGQSLAFNGGRIMVGEPKATNATPVGLDNMGAVHIFERDSSGSNGWHQVSRLTIADPPDDYFVSFGGSLALNGGILAVGNMRSYLNYNNTWREVCFFERQTGDSNEWKQVALVIGSGDYFGQALSVEGDLALVGSHDDFWAGEGLAYVFQRTPSGTSLWSRVGVLRSPKGENDFGMYVALHGDTAFVGCHRHANERGSVYRFDRDAGGVNAWGYTGEIIPQGSTSTYYFASSFASDGDVMIVGAPGEDALGLGESGSAYIFEWALHGPPAFTQINRRDSNVLMEFTSQPAWRYDLEATTNALANDWAPVPGKTNIVGATDGDSATSDALAVPSRLYRIRRHAP